MKSRPSASLYLSVCLLLLSHRAHAEPADQHEMWQKSGDLLQWGIPIFGLGLSFVLHDEGEPFHFDLSSFQSGSGLDAIGTDGTASGLNWPGPRLGGSDQHDFVVSFARMELATYGLKYAVDAKRPNGGNQSFPSGHTAASFMGAEFIRQHYGPWWGVPAYLAAGWVGWTRVDSHNHYWRDVAGGAAIGILSNYDFDSIDTRHGSFSFGPAMINPADALWDRPDPLTENPLDANPVNPAPGLRLEWRF